MTTYNRKVEIADTLRAEIEDGKYPPGTNLPPLKVLTKRFDVSPMTVAGAIKVLVNDGLVSSRRGAGTVVLDRRPPITVDYASSPGGLDPWEAACRRLGLEGRIEVLAVGEGQADASTASALGLPDESPVIRRYQHALLEGQTLQLRTALYPTHVAEGTALAGTERIEDVQAVLRDAGHAVATADHQVAARMATAEEARQLGLPPGAPVLVLQRISLRADGTPVELLRVVAHSRHVEFVFTGLKG